MLERRAAKRLHTAIPVTVTLLGTALSLAPITVETEDISPDGLSLVITIKTRLEQGRLTIEGGEEDRKLVKYLLLDNKRLALDINILPQGESLHATGTVKWSYRNVQEGSYYLKAGVAIEKMEREPRARWLEFLGTTYRFMACLEPSDGDRPVVPIYGWRMWPV
jgi:hypothetical protein